MQMFRIKIVFLFIEGALRVDANVSISKSDTCLGTRTELKNIGSVRAVSNAIKYEINRQISILEAGGEVVNETRGWDPLSKKTILMREKEEKHVTYLMFIRILSINRDFVSVLRTIKCS